MSSFPESWLLRKYFSFLCLYYVADLLYVAYTDLCISVGGPHLPMKEPRMMSRVKNTMQQRILTNLDDTTAHIISNEENRYTKSLSYKRGLMILHYNAGNQCCYEWRTSALLKNNK